MSVGAAQLLLKTAAEIQSRPGRAGRQRAVLVAARVAVPRRRRRSRGDARHHAARPLRRGRSATAWGFMRSQYFAKGLKLVRDIHGRVRIIEAHVTALAAEGQGRLDTVRYEVDARVQSIPSGPAAAVHQGVVPNINLTNADRLRAPLERATNSFDPVVDGSLSEHVPQYRQRRNARRAALA